MLTEDPAFFFGFSDSDSNKALVVKLQIELKEKNQSLEGDMHDDDGPIINATARVTHICLSSSSRWFKGYNKVLNTKLQQSSSNK